ncbi:MAG TPA: YggS family pyridoxal phosphate-dependent enzyme, partial [Candidatus Wallbacteria bacterium]|nr:YggS family pyridoxal phosphate-dependent enzyme [Candidatus Wallbacteria bacterium]
NSLGSLEKRIADAVDRRNIRFKNEYGTAPISSGGITVVAASKYVDAHAIIKAAKAGVKIFGENRVQALKEKSEFIKNNEPDIFSNIEFQLIGHLQSNKVRDAVLYSSLIQSVDSLKIAERINEYCEKSGKDMSVLIELKTSSEETKAGVAEGSVREIAAGITKLSRLKFAGIMTMSELTDDINVVRRCFDSAYRVFASLAKEYPASCKYLSMGMTDDFETAIECGANMIRPGRVIFVNN